MVEVITMPPVNYTAVSQALENPRSVSTGISGAPRFSQTRESRRKFGVSIHGIGTDMAGHGWVEQLRRRLNNQAPIVQIEVRPDGWHLAMDAVFRARNHGYIKWTYSGGTMLWTYKSAKLPWWYSDLNVSVGNDYGGNYLSVSGLSPNSTVAYPGERVTQKLPADLIISGRVQGLAKTNAAGTAKIYVDTVFNSGILQLGAKEWAYAYINEMPPTMQPSGAGYTYEWSMTEVLETDYAEFDLIQPWR